MSKLVTQLHQQNSDDPAYIRLAALTKTSSDHRELFNDCSRHQEALKEAATQAATAFYQSPTLERAKALSAIRRERADFDAVIGEVSTSVSIQAEDIKHTVEAMETLRDALRVFQKSLRAKINELADDERARLEKAGLEPGGQEHPAIVALRAELSRVADGIIHCENCIENKDANRTACWSKHSSIIRF